MKQRRSCRCLYQIRFSKFCNNIYCCCPVWLALNKVIQSSYQKQESILQGRGGNDASRSDENSSLSGALFNAYIL